MRALLLSMLLLATPAWAADLALSRGSDPGISYIRLAGRIEWNDDVRFAQLAAQAPNAVVVLDSFGGRAVTGIQIGHLIHDHHYTTLVLNGTSCTSACGLVWLGGTTRIMQPGSQIGFHAAYVEKTLKISAYGNALVGKYFGYLGLGDDAIQFLTDAGPNEMAYLKPAMAKALNIEVVEAPLVAEQVVPKLDYGQLYDKTTVKTLRTTK